MDKRGYNKNKNPEAGIFPPRDAYAAWYHPIFPLFIQTDFIMTDNADPRDSLPNGKYRVFSRPTLAGNILTPRILSAMGCSLSLAPSFSAVPVVIFSVAYPL
jgi:hypothetical protein